MKLKAVDVVNDLNGLELGEVFLFGDGYKSISVLFKEDNLPRIVVALKKEKQYFFFNEKDKAQELYEKAFTLTNDIYEDRKKFSDFIKKCEIDVKYRYADVKSISIDKESDGTFCWTYTVGWKVAFPTKSANLVQTFKTEMGARRSLIKYLGLDSGS